MQLKDSKKRGRKNLILNCWYICDEKKRNPSFGSAGEQDSSYSDCWGTWSTKRLCVSSRLCVSWLLCPQDVLHIKMGFQGFLDCYGKVFSSPSKLAFLPRRLLLLPFQVTGGQIGACWVGMVHFSWESRAALTHAASHGLSLAPRLSGN